MKTDIKKSAILGAWITATVLLLNWLLTFVNVQVSELFGISGTTGITSTIGSKFIAILQNFVAFDILSIVYVWISATAIILVGGFAMDMLPLPKGKSNVGTLTLTLLYGTAVFYLLLVGFGIPPMGALVGLLLYYVAVAITFSIFRKQLKSF